MIHHHHVLSLLTLLSTHHPASASASASAATLTDRFLLLATTRRSFSDAPQHHVDPTPPRPLLPEGPPHCSLPLFRRHFAGDGPAIVTANYTPPLGCPAPWSRVVLDVSASCAGDGYDRVAAVWLAGIELLRSATPQPAGDEVRWRVRKDVTRYSPLLQQLTNGHLVVMLADFSGDLNISSSALYHVNVSLNFYLDEPNRRIIKELSAPEIRNPTEKKLKVAHLYQEPADLILPVSSQFDLETGFWYRLENESDFQPKSIEIPMNSYRAVLEIFGSSHGDDEFWYSNPPNSYLEENNITSGRRNGAFREVFAAIDGRFVGSVVPFPIILPGGINPLFWDPVAAIRAFDIPSYDLDLTPFLGLLLDGKLHNFTVGVSDCIPFWLIGANLHLWLDPNSVSVNAELVDYNAPNVAISVTNKSVSHLIGSFFTEATRKLHFSGWVNSSLGNFTTEVEQKAKFKTSIEFGEDGNYKGVSLKAKSKNEVRIKDGPKSIIARMSYKTKYPLMMTTSVLEGENNTYTLKTNVLHTLYEESSHALGKEIKTIAIVDRQVVVGQMVVDDQTVVEGSASSQQTYQYRDGGGCYIRRVGASDGILLYDNSTDHCGVLSL